MDLRTVKTLRAYHQQMYAFRCIFRGKQCRIPYDSLRIFVAGSITGYGCSEEAAIMMMGCTFKLLIHMMGIMDITNKMVAYALPSRATLATSEHRLAADCVIVSRQKIKNDGAKKIRIMSDHGHRSGQDHLVKIALWSGYDSRTRSKTIKRRTINIDSGSHTAKGCANTIKKSINVYLGGISDDIKVYSATGDAGGGGATQHIHPKLIANGTMASDSKRANCALHGMNKAIERAGKDVFRKQGLGHYIPFQLLYVFSTLMKHSIKSYGQENLISCGHPLLKN
jgi:hypothetical protein